MTSAAVSTVDLRVIESVLEMASGYVLDFSNQSYANFFREHGVDIDDRRFSVDGSSKANRLRCFLRTAGPPLTGRVLAGLLRHRMVAKPDGLRATDLDGFRDIIVRLGGEVPAEAKGTSRTDEVTPEAELLRRVFRPELFAKLPVDAPISQALVGRMSEAQRCIATKAHLAAVILCGSVLEGMCLGFGTRYPERANRAYSEQYRKAPPQFHDWKLREWVEVLGHLGDLSPNVEKFGQALRDFRNYIHPAEQLAHRFSPDQHTARIGFQVVIAAAEDLVRAAARVQLEGR